MLMDTGGSYEKLVWNARALGVDLSELDAVFISHWHGDHCGALPELLRALRREIPVFVPRAPGWLMRRELAGLGARLTEVREPSELVPGVLSTGDMGGEHSLALRVKELGLAVITGCSHPGPGRVVQRALEAFGGPIHALIGGFHIHSYHEGLELGRLLSGLGLKLVCPCHCTGLRAKEGLRASFKGQVIQCGVGRRIEL